MNQLIIEDNIHNLEHTRVLSTKHYVLTGQDRHSIHSSFIHATSLLYLTIWSLEDNYIILEPDGRIICVDKSVKLFKENNTKGLSADQ